MGVMVAGIIRYYPTTSALEHAVAQQFPTEMLPFLKTHALAGPMLNEYLWGGYLSWNDKDLKIFIDSRVDIFEYYGVLGDYLDLIGMKRIQPVFDKYHIRYALFPPDQPITLELERDPGWKVVTRNKVSVLFERASEAAASAAGATAGRDTNTKAKGL
jgi:hypothetical protein